MRKGHKSVTQPNVGLLRHPGMRCSAAEAKGHGAHVALRDPCDEAVVVDQVLERQHLPAGTTLEYPAGAQRCSTVSSGHVEALGGRERVLRSRLDRKREYRRGSPKFRSSGVCVSSCVCVRACVFVRVFVCVCLCAC